MPKTPKVRTDKDLIEKFLTRGVEAIYPSADELRKKLLSGDRIRVYQGYDPTGPYLHVGHAMGIRAMRILQQLGHEVIFLVGDFTSRVGDPDKDSARRLLSMEQIEQNMKGWEEQAAQLIDFGGDNPVQFKHNYDWLSKLTLEQLIELMSHMTMQRMLERDMFERRYKAGDPIGLQEFIYPLMQGYDGVAMEVDMEIGGADQTFNMLTGRQLSRAYLNKEKYVRANKMMDAPEGRTMSKTKGNGINLSDTAEDMYGKAMSYPDKYIATGLEYLTDVPTSKIVEIEKEIKAGKNPMEFKKFMAFEIAREIKGEKAAEKAQSHFEKTVQGGQNPEEVGDFQMGVDKMNVVDLIVLAGLAPSKSEARRLVTQGGVKYDDQTVAGIDSEISAEGKVLKVGKRKFVRIKR